MWVKKGSYVQVPSLPNFNMKNNETPFYTRCGDSSLYGILSLSPESKPEREWRVKTIGDMDMRAFLSKTQMQRKRRWWRKAATSSLLACRKSRWNKWDTIAHRTKRLTSMSFWGPMRTKGQGRIEIETNWCREHGWRKVALNSVHAWQEKMKTMRHR